MYKNVNIEVESGRLNTLLYPIPPIRSISFRSSQSLAISSTNQELAHWMVKLVLCEDEVYTVAWVEPLGTLSV